MSPITKRFINDVEKLKLRFPVQMISERTNTSKSNVSLYLNGKREPSSNFLKKFYAEFFPDTGITESMVVYEPEEEYLTKDKYIKQLEDHLRTKDELINQLRKEIENFKSSTSGKRRRSAL